MKRFICVLLLFYKSNKQQEWQSSTTDKYDAVMLATLILLLIFCLIVPLFKNIFKTVCLKLWIFEIIAAKQVGMCNSKNLFWWFLVLYLLKCLLLREATAVLAQCLSMLFKGNLSNMYDRSTEYWIRDA